MKKILIIVALHVSCFSYAQFFIPNQTVSATSNPATGNVGIGESAPQAKLSVLENSGLGTSMGNHKLLSRFSMIGNVNHFMINEWLYRDANGDDWFTARAHNGISVDASFLTPGVNTRTWWERDPYNSIQSWGDGNQTYMTLNQGNVGIGVSNPGYKLSISSVEDQTVLGENKKSVIRIMNGFGGGFGRRSEIQFGLSQLSNESLAVIAAEYSTWNGFVGGDLLFGTTPNNSAVMFERMRINSNGNIGIGTSAPVAKLTLGTYTGTMTSSTGIALGIDQNNIEFLNSGFGAGFGAKLYGLDQGNGLTSFRLAVRGNSATWTDALFVHAGTNGVGGGNTGYIGIGTNNPSQRLTVKGTVYSTEVKVDVNAGTGPDYVFEPTYNLPTLTETEAYIKANKHLPEVPSAKEMEANGINLSEMNMLLLKKVEELTLHLIEQNKYLQKMKSDDIQQNSIIVEMK